MEGRAQVQRQEVGHRTGKSFWFWLRVGQQAQEVGRRRKGRRKRWLRSDCRWSDAKAWRWRWSDARWSDAKAWHWRWSDAKRSRSDCRWSDAMAWKWSDANSVEGPVMAWRMATNACQEVIKAVDVVPDVIKALDAWRGAVFPVRQGQLAQPHVCQHHHGVFAKAHIPEPQPVSLRRQPAKKANVVATLVANASLRANATLVHILGGFLLRTFPLAYATWEPPHAVSSAVLPRMGTPFAVVATRAERGRQGAERGRQGRHDDFCLPAVPNERGT